MAKIRGVCYWVGTTLQAVRKYFERQPQNPGIGASTYSYSTDEPQGNELGSSGERGHPEPTGDSIVRQDTTLLDSQTPQQALRSSTIKLAQYQETNISSSVDSTMLNIIRDDITEKLGESNENKEERFLIRSSLEPLLNIQTVEKILNEAKQLGDGVDIPKLAKFITGRALSVFAILIKMDRPHLIKSFYRDDFNENMLPIRYEGARSNWSVKSYFGKASNTASDAALQDIFTQDGWTYSDVAEFCDTNQWHFFPLAFTKERFRYEISSDMRLPYTAAKELKTTNSNYSRVEKRSIYPECFESSIQTVLDDDKNFCVAVKKLIHSNEEEADKEAIALEDIRKSSNVHLIKAIAYIRTEPKIEYSFVFPWAEHGNLWDFWVRQEGAPTDREYFIRVFRQLTCLACAINELSDKGLRHGDLKPENIVCFKTDDGLPTGEEKVEDMVRLVIIDVGLAKIHDENTQLRAKTDTRVSTRRYAAPELETHPNERLSRRFDVWSMGCIFLEFAIWLIYGNQELLAFTTGRAPSETEKFKFFVTKPNHEHLDSGEGPKQIADRHPTVNGLISKMQNNPWCSNGTAVRRLIDLISNKMLVVDLSDDKHPKPETESQSTCKCVQDDAHLVSSRSAENGSDAEQENTPKRNPFAQPPLPEIRISKAPTMSRVTTNPHSAGNNSPSKPGRPYARVIKEELESILANLENGSIDAIKLDDKATKPAEASGLLNIAHRVR